MQQVQTPSQSTLFIKPINAQLNLDPNSTKVDPYIIFNTSTNKVQSSVCYGGGKNPQWNDSLEIQVNSTDRVLVEVWGYPTPGPDGIIAVGELPVSKVAIMGGNYQDNLPLYFKGQPAGSIYVSCMLKSQNTQQQQQTQQFNMNTQVNMTTNNGQMQGFQTQVQTQQQPYGTNQVQTQQSYGTNQMQTQQPYGTNQVQTQQFGTQMQPQQQFGTQIQQQQQFGTNQVQVNFQQQQPQMTVQPQITYQQPQMVIQQTQPTFIPQPTIQVATYKPHTTFVQPVQYVTPQTTIIQTGFPQTTYIPQPTIISPTIIQPTVVKPNTGGVISSLVNEIFGHHHHHGHHHHRHGHHKHGHHKRW